MKYDDKLAELAGNFPTPARDQWLKLVEKALKGADFDRRLVSQTADGLRIEPLYTQSAQEAGDAAMPGDAPFTRGTERKPRGLGWDIRQLHIETDPESANKAILEDLEGGVGSIVLQLSAPTQLGLEPDAAVLGEALKNVDLSICPIALQAGAASLSGGEALNSVWQNANIADTDRKGSLHIDPLGTLAATGCLADTLEVEVGAAASVLKETLNAPGLTALIADGRPYHAAGASEAEELAAMLSTLVAYLRAADVAGVAPADALPKIAIGLVADTDQFLTIAKLRAARQLIWRIAEAAGAGSATANVHMTATTAWRALTKRDPWVNMLRGTMACTAAVFGGANAVTVLPFTLPLGRADSFARRVARNTQIVLQEESNLGRVVDPAGGSWYVENLTADLAKAAWKVFQDIEGQRHGREEGMAAAVLSGFIQDKISRSAETRAHEIAIGKRALTGTSAFPKLGEDGITVEPFDQTPEPAAKSSATVTAQPLHFARLAEPFENLRDAADAFAARTGTAPHVFLASIGAIAEHTARTTWMKNFLAAGGIEALISDGYANADEAAAAFKSSGASAACICSSDALYAEHAETTAAALRGAGASTIFLAGKPGEYEPQWKAAGIDDFLHLGRDAVATLSALHETLGVSSNDNR